MTQLRKSDSQLDAEAAAPERPLAAAIAHHRALFHADLWIARLHQRDGESGLGPPFSPPFEALLDNRLGGFPWSKGLYAVRVECRRSHSEHRERDEWLGSLCHTLVSLVVRADYSYERACYELTCDPARTEKVLHRALRRIEAEYERARQRDRDRTSPPAREPAEWMSEVTEPRHDQGGLHPADCPKCLRRAAA